MDFSGRQSTHTDRRWIETTFETAVRHLCGSPARAPAGYPQRSKSGAAARHLELSPTGCQPASHSPGFTTPHKALTRSFGTSFRCLLAVSASRLHQKLR